jgi:hypothetical protein
MLRMIVAKPPPQRTVPSPSTFFWVFSTLASLALPCPREATENTRTTAQMVVAAARTPTRLARSETGPHGLTPTCGRAGYRTGSIPCQLTASTCPRHVGIKEVITIIVMALNLG